MPAFWGYPPPPHDYPYHWVILDPKSKEDKVKVTNLKNSPKFQIFVFWNKHYMQHTFCIVEYCWGYRADTILSTDGQGETSIPPFQLRWSGGYNNFKISPWKSMVKVMCVVKSQGDTWPSTFKGQGHGQGQTHWSHLRPGVQSICLLFISWQSDYFWLRYSKFYIWPWKFKVKVTTKINQNLIW